MQYLDDRRRYEAGRALGRFQRSRRRAERAEAALLAALSAKEPKRNRIEEAEAVLHGARHEVREASAWFSLRGMSVVQHPETGSLSWG